MHFLKRVAHFALYCNETGFSFCPSSPGFLQARWCSCPGWIFLWVSCLVWVLLSFFGWLGVGEQCVCIQHMQQPDFSFKQLLQNWFPFWKLSGFGWRIIGVQRALEKEQLKTSSGVEQRWNPQGMGIDLSSLNHLWERGIERMTRFFPPSNHVQAASLQTPPSHYRTKAKDLYKLLLMAKNIAMLNQFDGVITAFLFLVKVFFSSLYSPVFTKPEGAK